METGSRKKDMRLDSALLILLGSILKGVATAINDFNRQQPSMRLRQRGGNPLLKRAAASVAEQNMRGIQKQAQENFKGVSGRLQGLASQAKRAAAGAVTPSGMAGIKGELGSRFSRAKSLIPSPAGRQLALAKIPKGPPLQQVKGVPTGLVPLVGEGVKLGMDFLAGRLKDGLSLLDGLIAKHLPIGTQGRNLALPIVNEQMGQLAVVIREMAESEESKEKLEALANALTQAANEILIIATPRVEAIAGKAVLAAGDVGSTIAARGANAAMRVVNSAVGQIPGVGLVWNTVMLFLTLVAGAVKVAQEVTQGVSSTATQAIGGVSELRNVKTGNVTTAARGVKSLLKDSMAKASGNRSVAIPSPSPQLEEIAGGRRRRSAMRKRRSGRGTKRRGTKRRGTKRRGTKRRGTKRRGTKRQSRRRY